MKNISHTIDFRDALNSYFIFFRPFETVSQITFQKVFDISNYPTGGNKMIQTIDGGYIIYGTTWYGAGSNDLFISKIDSIGNLEYTRIIGGIKIEIAGDIIQSADGNYFICGTTKSFSPWSYNEAFLSKINSMGDMLWTKTYGDASYANCMLKTADGGFLLGGSISMGGIDSDCYAVKVDSLGQLQWAKSYGIPNMLDVFNNIQETFDGKYALFGDKGFYASPNRDVTITKINESGDLIWSKSFGGPYIDYGIIGLQTSDSGFIVIGATYGFDTTQQQSTPDYYVIKTDSIGNHIWSKSYGGIYYDFAYGILENSNNEYIIAGNSTNPFVGSDIYVIKINDNGDTLWTRNLASNGDDRCYSLNNASDGGYILTGFTRSFGFNIGANYIIKTDSNFNFGCNENYVSKQIMVTPTIEANTGFVTGIFNPVLATPAFQIDSAGGITTICQSLGTNEFSFVGTSLIIKPNPATDVISLNWNRSINSGNIKIINCIGSIVFFEPIIKESSKNVSLYGLTPGVYFASIFDGQNYFFCKFFVF